MGNQGDQSGKVRNRIYAAWYRGPRQLRLALTVLGQRPVLDLRLGDESSSRWTPSTKGVLIELEEIDGLIASLRKASADIKKLGLLKNPQHSQRARPLRKRWARD
jgi:hypothetical protein